MNNHEMKELLREAIKEELTPFKEEVKTMFSAHKEELTSFKEEVKTMFSAHKEEFTPFKEETKMMLSALKEELTPFKEETRTMFSALKEGQEKTHAELIAFKDEIHERFDHQDRRFRLLDADLDGLNAQIQKNTRDIESTKKQIGNQ